MLRHWRQHDEGTGVDGLDWGKATDLDDLQRQKVSGILCNNVVGTAIECSEPQELCADCVALGILSLLAGMAADDGDSRGQWRLSRNPCSPHASLRERRRLGHGHGYGRSSVNAPSEWAG